MRLMHAEENEAVVPRLVDALFSSCEGILFRHASASDLSDHKDERSGKPLCKGRVPVESVSVGFGQ